MNKYFVVFKSFRAKVTAALILLICFSGAVNNLLISQYSLKSQLSQLRGKLAIIAQTMAMSVDPTAITA